MSLKPAGSDPEGMTTPDEAWSVWRQDDIGNTFLVRTGLTEPEALSLVGQLEEEGHKQTYWAAATPISPEPAGRSC